MPGCTRADRRPAFEVPEHWTAERLRSALNSQLPDDVWVARVSEMTARLPRPLQRDRHVATATRWGSTRQTHSPFRRRWEFAWTKADRALSREALDWCAERTMGQHRFFGFAVRGTAPATDDHRCDVRCCRWRDSPEHGGLVLDIEANRFLHHMVRFLVGTMLDVAERPAAARGVRSAPRRDGERRSLAAGSAAGTLSRAGHLPRRPLPHRLTTERATPDAHLPRHHVARRNPLGHRRVTHRRRRGDAHHHRGGTPDRGRARGRDGHRARDERFRSARACPRSGPTTSTRGRANSRRSSTTSSSRSRSSKTRSRPSGGSPTTACASRRRWSIPARRESSPPRRAPR